MRKFLRCFTLAVFFSLTILQANAQERCGTMDKHTKLYRKDAQYRARYEQQNEAIQVNSLRGSSTEGTVYRVPVVVHVMHVGEAVGVGTNISLDQVYSAISSINDAYRRKSGTIYSANGVDMEIEFCLAQKDPNGNATTGINRINASGTGNYGKYGITDTNEIAIKALSKWSNTKYYNIWVVSQIDNNGAQDGVQGYAYFAGAPPSLDGAVMLYNSFGYDPEGTRNYSLKNYTDKNITCIHEMGHAFGLYHTFEGDNNGNSCPANANGCGSGIGDCCADIPAHRRSQSNCVTGINACDNVTSRELFIHNYMDYSSDACQNMFTANQYTRARNFLATGGSRASLVSSANLIACGCNGNTAPIARFYAINKQPCEGTTVQFVNESLNAPASYNWSFTGAWPLTASSQNPTVIYSDAGPYGVSLTVTSSAGQSNTITKLSYIWPLITPSAALPFVESFEGVFPPAGWNTLSNDAATTWGSIGTKVWEKRAAIGSGAGDNAVAINLYEYNYSGESDDLLSPYFNLVGVVNPSLSFKVAYKYYDNTHADTLAIFAVANCSNVATRIYYKGGAALQSTVQAGDNFAPANALDWRTETIDLSAYIGQKVRFQFKAINDYGDNLYLDNVNVIGDYTTPVANFNASKTSGITTGTEVITFTNTSSGNINSYTWNFGTGATPTTANTVGPHSVTYSSPGTKTVSLTVAGPGGTNTVNKVDYVTVVTSIISTSALENAGIKVYPNPAKDVLYIDASNSEFVSAELLDVISNTVISEVKTDGSKLEMSLIGKPQGLYLLLIRTTQGSFGTRIIKMNE